MRLFRLALAASVIAALAGCLAQPPNSWWEGYEHHARLIVLPDGRKMNLYCEGVGTPTVVFDSGIGEGAWSWRMVQDVVAKTTRSCAYDRAGYGTSDPGPLPRDAASNVADLTAMLTAGEIQGPYVMVGHSRGSYDVRLFADRHLGDVAGMVLVDPASDFQYDRLGAVMPHFLELQASAYAPMKKCLALIQAGTLQPGSDDAEKCIGDPPPDLPKDVQNAFLSNALRPNQDQTTLAEFESTNALDSKEVSNARRNYGDIPLIVLTAENTSKIPVFSTDQQAAGASVWNRMHDELATLSTKGVNRMVHNSGHYIQYQQPQAVIDAVNEVVGAVRHGQTGTNEKH
jgi:pimeloyl-ACP methyl ester carboxylesterase